MLFLEKVLILDIKLPSLPIMLLSKALSMDLTEFLIHHHGIPDSITSDQENHSQQIKYDNGPTLTEFIGLTLFLIILQQLSE